MHVLNGAVIFPAIYRYVVDERRPRSPAMRGLAWGIVRWLVAQLVVMLMLGGYLQQGCRRDDDRLESSISHAMHGATLGIVASLPETRLAHARYDVCVNDCG